MYSNVNPRLSFHHTGGVKLYAFGNSARSISVSRFVATSNSAGYAMSSASPGLRYSIDVCFGCSWSVGDDSMKFT